MYSRPTSRCRADRDRCCWSALVGILNGVSGTVPTLSGDTKKKKKCCSWRERTALYLHQAAAILQLLEQENERNMQTALQGRCGNQRSGSIVL